MKAFEFGNICWELLHNGFGLLFLGKLQNKQGPYIRGLRGAIIPLPTFLLSEAKVLPVTNNNIAFYKLTQNTGAALRSYSKEKVF